MYNNRFSNKAEAALSLAAQMAAALGQGYVGTEHILLGLLREGTSAAAQILANYGIEEERVLALIRQLIAPMTPVNTADRGGYSPRAARVLENSYKEAVQFKSPLIGTEHILIAMLKDGECSATRLLSTMNVNIQRMYVDILASMGEDASQYKDELEGKGKGQGKKHYADPGQLQPGSDSSGEGRKAGSGDRKRA